ncbi:MAG: hypothetical protein WCH43_13635 [Verrucomicrobiota bacterium]
MPNLPRFAVELLAACPTAGTGVHAWLFKCAGTLHRAGCTEAEIADLINTAAAGCGRELAPHEIPNAICNSRTNSGNPKSRSAGGKYKLSRWPKLSKERIDAILSATDAPGLVDLWECSPVRFEDSASHTEEMIDRLFPGNPLLCCGWRHDRFGTDTREEWRGKLQKLQFIVPSPMLAEEGARKSGGQLSPRTLENTGPRRYLVVEFDDKLGEDSQAARLWHLNTFSPLVMAVHSGGKSIHGWFCAHGDPEPGWRKFMRYAVSIGADYATWSRCQLVRMPGGLRREDGKKLAPQTVYYFNPEILPC